MAALRFVVVSLFVLVRLLDALGLTSLARSLWQADLAIVGVLAAWWLIVFIFRKNTYPYK
jgi:hypothetical protein